MGMLQIIKKHSFMTWPCIYTALSSLIKGIDIGYHQMEMGGFSLTLIVKPNHPHILIQCS